MINRNKKILRTLADQIEQWCQSPAFTLTPQTVSALTTTLCVHAMLIEDLLNEAYQYAITARLQIDPVEDVFPSTGKSMAVGFLSIARSPKLREVLLYRFLLKENITFWEEDLTSENLECVTVTEDIEHGKSWKVF